MFKKKEIYLDYAASTPIDEGVVKKMHSYESNFFANPSAVHNDGLKVKNIVDNARGKIAKLINAHSDEIIFTGSGTESDALAVIGVVRNWNLQNKGKTPHIITTKIEHPAVLENCRLLEKTGEAEVTYLSVDKGGIVNLEELEDSLQDNTILVSVMYANNEIGTIEPIEEIAKIIRRFRKGKSTLQKQAEEGLSLREPKDSPSSVAFPLFHTDASQAMNYLYTENIEKLGVDMMTFNSSKIYGPKGIGVLYKKRNIELYPLYMGGGQEFGLHSGTSNVVSIAGVAEALEIANKIKKKEVERLIPIRDYGIQKLLSISKELPYKIILNGDKEKRLPNNINISVSGISSELLVIELSSQGIFVSEKSACKSSDENKSYVIEAIRKICPKDGKEEEGSLRISLGRDTTKEDMDALVKAFKKILEKYKEWK
ncbi:MAG TPA: cysteine desulfurase family protein [Candidatus Paceibacterota bacterium]|nr:cysteine desulfurase family protein [Candidatus Paceibacterota bacterium]